MKIFQKIVVLSAVLLGGWFLFGHTNEVSAAVTLSGVPSCSYEATNYSVNLSWTEPPGGFGGTYVDISTDAAFNQVWNVLVPSGTYSRANIPSGFTESAWDAVSPNVTPTIGLVVNTTYYIRIYNGTHYPNASPGISFSVPECPPPSAPTTSGLPSCATTAGYTGNLNWSGGVNPAYGFYVDISDNSFGRWWTKNVNPGTSTSFPAGFNGYSGVSGAMGNLSPGVTYYARVFNGEHSTITSFSVPMCAQPTCTNTGPNNYTVPYGTNSHTVYISTSNATAVNFAVIPPSAPAVWYSGVPNGIGYFSATIDLSTYPQYGAFTVDVYMNNSNWTDVGCAFHPNFTRQSPMPATCTGAGPDGFVTYNDFGNHTVDVTGVHSSATAVNIAVFRNGVTPYWYLSSTGQVQNLGSGLWRLTFDLASHVPYLYQGPVNVHVYMNNPYQTNTFCDYADFTKQLRPAPTAPVVTPSDALPCTNNPYSVTLSWTGQPRPSGAPTYEGFYVDASTVPGFGSSWNKLVGVSTFSTPAGTGFAPYSGVSGPLTLMPNTTYYFRVYNDSHSATTTYSRPRCGSLEIVVNQPGGNWTLNGPNGFTKTGTGAQSFNPTACAGNSYYCIPVGNYTLVPTPNSPSGYNGTAAPSNHTVN